VNPAQLELRAEILAAFAATGAPPDLPDSPDLRALEQRHVVVLDEAARIRMAHPFAAHREGARVDAAGRTWWGNCAWDGFGIVHALGLAEATVSAQGITIAVRDGVPEATDAVFDVAVPAAHWWDDVAHT
jgi:hypothetical protein